MNITFTDNAIKRFKQNLEKKPDAVGLGSASKQLAAMAMRIFWTMPLKLIKPMSYIKFQTSQF